MPARFKAPALGALAAVLMVAAAAEKTKAVELKKVFPYLDAYLDLPPATRSKFVLVYRMKVTGVPQGALKAAYVTGEARAPVPIAADGKVLRLPTSAMIRSGHKIEVTAPEGAKLGVAMQIEPVARPAAEIDARELAQAVGQAAAGVRKAAGLFGFAAPKMEAVMFKGGAGGQVILANGAAPLPVINGHPAFVPASFPTARLVRFTRAPSEMFIGPAKR